MISHQILTPEEVSLTTLESLSSANLLNEWMFETIRPYVKGRILEIGSGIGNISSCFIRNSVALTVSDISDDYCRRLKDKFEDEPLVDDILQIDLVDEAFDKRYARQLSTFNTVFALNVVEHIKDDAQAIANCRKLLAPGGHLIILVPANPALYNVLDRELEHYRRYTHQSIKRLLSRELDVFKTFSFNLAGILGWFISGSIARKKTLPSGQITIYNKLVPLFRIADEMVFHQIGLSVICVGRKK